MRVLLLDDHILFSKSLEIAFESSDILLKSFTDPERIFNGIEKLNPDLVLLDIHIGNFSGFDIAEKISNKFPNQKIAFLSGFDFLEYENEARKAKAWGLLNKNSTIEELTDNLKKMHSGINILPKDHKLLDTLSEREKEILKCAAEGLKQQEIADKLFISRRTVNNHLLSINDKLDVNSTVSAIIQAINLGIIRVKGF